MNTPRKPDAAERIANEWYPAESYTPGEETEYAEASRIRLASKIRRAINAAGRPVWRPMSEPPEPGVRVVLQLHRWNLMIAWHDGFNWFWHSGIIERPEGHWTELPTPPKARKGAPQ